MPALSDLDHVIIQGYKTQGLDGLCDLFGNTLDGVQEYICALRGPMGA